MPEGTLGLVIVIGASLLFLWVSRWMIAVLSSTPAEVDPEDVVAVDQDYRCSVCGAELTLRSVNVQETGPPKHCREEMDPVWRP